ncbi:MAG: MFS transporter [Planctomycetia bacterium]|nr:MFS transporter [Planctomycetia bacterium]
MPSLADGPNPYQSPAAAGQRATHKRYIVMALLGLLAFLTYFDRVSIVRAKTEIKAEFGLEDWQMGLVMGSFWLAYALFELPAGWMGDRFGSRSTLTRIVLAWSLFTALSGSAVGLLSLLSCRFLFGVGEAGAFPNMARVQSRWVPVGSRARASGMLWLMARWGGAFAPLIFGTMMQGIKSPRFQSMMAGVPGLSHLTHMAAWRLGFWISGLLGLLWVAAFWPWFRDHPSEKKSVNEAELELITAGAPPEVKGHTMPRGMWGALLTSRSLWAMGIYYLCGSFGWSFFVSWMDKYFNDVHKVTYKNSEWSVAMPLFFGGITCLVGGALCQALVRRTGWMRWGRAVFPLGGALVAAVAMLAMQWAKTPQQATVLFCVTAIAYDFGQAANWATIIDIGGKYSGTAAGLINMIGNIANAFQPLIATFIFNSIGWNWLFRIYALAFVIAACMWLIIDPRRTFYAGREQTLRASRGDV